MAKLSKNQNLVGSWAFLIGVLLAVILGLIGDFSQTWTIVLVVVGLLVGLLNVVGAETNPFLMSGVSLIITSAFGGAVLANVPLVSNVLNSLLVIFVPATVIVAVKNVFSLAKD